MNVDEFKFNAYTSIQDKSLNKTLIYTTEWEIADILSHQLILAIVGSWSEQETG